LHIFNGARSLCVVQFELRNIALRDDAPSDTFRPTAADNPPQEKRREVRVRFHAVVKSRDYVFAESGKK
jgi:hypothetical protein